MDENIQLFKHEDFGKLRVISQDGEPWFVAKDVAQTLGYANTKDAIKRHCHGVVKRYPIVDSLGRTQQVRIITESDIYRLITHSKLPAAQKFETWVFKEVLPSIRETGGYVFSDGTEDEGALLEEPP